MKKIKEFKEKLPATTVSLLIRILTNVLQHKENITVKRLACNSTKYQHYIQPHANAVKILQISGFVEIGDLMCLPTNLSDRDYQDIAMCAEALGHTQNEETPQSQQANTKQTIIKHESDDDCIDLTDDLSDDDVIYATASDVKKSLIADVEELSLDSPTMESPSKKRKLVHTKLADVEVIEDEKPIVIAAPAPAEFPSFKKSKAKQSPVPMIISEHVKKLTPKKEVANAFPTFSSPIPTVMHHWNSSQNIASSVEFSTTPISKAPYDFKRRLTRALNQSFQIVHIQTVSNTSRKVYLLGSYSNLYTVEISPFPRCTCPDWFKRRGDACKHILFVLVSVYSVPQDSRILYQKHFPESELQPIFSSPIPQHVLASDDVRQAFQQIIKKQLTPSEGRKSLDTETCIECRRPFLKDKELIVYCVKCGTNIHDDCWQQARCINSNCKCCQAPFLGYSLVTGVSGVIGHEGYVNMSQLTGTPLNTEKDNDDAASTPSPKKRKRNLFE